MVQHSVAATKHADVLIVGGGPAGLTLSIELSRLGVRTILIDMRDGTINTPKMNFVNVRTMEFVRRWGLTEKIRAAGHPPQFHPNVIWVTSVLGHEIARLDFPPFMEEKTRFYSPAADCLISQIWFDPILLDFAREQKLLRVFHRTKLNTFREVAGGVEAHVTDLASGEGSVIRAGYIVGCDGAQSTVREILGIKLQGLPAIQNNYHVFFKSSELLALFETKHGEARFCHLVGPDGHWGVITSIDWRGYWRFGMHPPPSNPGMVPDLLRRAVGRDFDFQLLNSSHWVSRELVADAYRQGRAFLAGDAAHQNTPSGGFGMNTAVGDSIDLAWKLWGTLSGWGGPQLLDNYEIERRPVALRNTQEATRNLMRGRKAKPGAVIDADDDEGAAQRAAYKNALFDAGTLRHHDTDGIALGYRYEASSITVPDGSSAPPDDVIEYVSTSRPGHRAPHAWIGGPPPSAGARLANGVSTLDLFGKSFVLLRFDHGIDISALQRAFAECGVPLQLVDLDDDKVAEVYERRLVLVRPDGHVAWRGDRAANSTAIADRIRGA